MTEESVSYYWNNVWLCVNETTPKSQKKVVAEKRGFCSMTMTSKVPTTIRFVNWSYYTRSLRMKQVSRALYEICYIIYIVYTALFVTKAEHKKHKKDKKSSTGIYYEMLLIIFISPW